MRLLVTGGAGLIGSHLTDLLVREGQILPRGGKCWAKLGQERLSSMARPLTEVGPAELWRGELWKSCNSCK